MEQLDRSLTVAELEAAERADKADKKEYDLSIEHELGLHESKYYEECPTCVWIKVIVNRNRAISSVG